MTLRSRSVPRVFRPRRLNPRLSKEEEEALDHFDQVDNSDGADYLDDWRSYVD
ncbi:ORF3 [Potato yellowing virus]|nr:ORF3 [Potato yellowing virus]